LALLSMCGNKLREITPHTLEKMNRQWHLVLVDNFIGHLEVDILQGLINFKYFYLTKYKLLAVYPDMFLGFPKIWNISLNFNPGFQIQLDSLHQFAF
jgi:hypothetical protein